MSGNLEGFLERARSLAEVVRSADSVAVVSHIDADGITSAAIAVQALKRMGIRHSLHFKKSLGEAEVDSIADLEEDLVWVCDLGTASFERMNRKRCVITDHHQCISSGQSPMDLYVYLDGMLNPVLFGMNGSTCISGAGATYFLARELDRANKDLAYLAIVGAVGDMQDRSAHRLEGALHAMVLEDARGMVEVVPNELSFFGWVTRSAAAMLAFSNELKDLGYRDSVKEVSSLFYEAGVSLMRSGASSMKEGKGTVWRSWSELSQPERNIMKVTLRMRLEELNLDCEALDRMLGEVYLFPDHPPGSPTREAKEFATLLNASGRYILTPDGKGDDERGDLIVNVCLNPKVYSESALRNVDNHKVRIREGVESVGRVEQMSNIQFLKSKNNTYSLKVNDTILGIIAGMVLDQKQEKGGLVVDCSKPIVAFAERQGSAEAGKDPEVKVSTRMRRELTSEGINLGKAVSEASSQVKGGGGGHDVAAGANIPKKKIKAFLDALDQEIGAQKERFSSSGRP